MRGHIMLADAIRSRIVRNTVKPVYNDHPWDPKISGFC